MDHSCPRHCLDFMDFDCNCDIEYKLACLPLTALISHLVWMLCMHIFDGSPPLGSFLGDSDLVGYDINIEVGT